MAAANKALMRPALTVRREKPLNLMIERVLYVGLFVAREQTLVH